MAFTGVKIVSIYNPINGDVVQLNDIGAESKLEIKSDPQDISNGSFVYACETATCEILAFDYAGYAKLAEWERTDTKVRMVSYGFDQHVLWDEDSNIIVTPSFDNKPGTRNSLKIHLYKKGVMLDIKVVKNIAFGKSGFNGEGANGLPDNYAATENLVADTNLRFNSQAAPNDHLQLFMGALEQYNEWSTTFIYPISNADFSAQAAIEQFELNPTGDVYCLVDIYDFNDNQLASYASARFNYDTFNTTIAFEGRIGELVKPLVQPQVIATFADANVYKVKVTFSVSNASANNSEANDYFLNSLYFGAPITTTTAILE